MTIHYQTIVILLSLIISACSFAGCDDKEEQIAILESEIPILMHKALIPGLSIALIRDGELLWENSYGVKNMNTKEDVTAETVFEAASLSKPVFAYAVMKLVERGIIDLDAPLLEYVSEEYTEKSFLRRKIKDERFKKITTRMILSHQTGFPNWRRNDSLEFLFEPGERFGYSGEGFGYLQKTVEKITGLSLNEFVRKEVFTPLNMNHSSFIWEEAYEESTSFPHNRIMDVGEKRKYTRGHAAANLHTTAEDYARFILEIISPAGAETGTIETMLTPQVTVDSDETPEIEWGLGFGLERTENEVSFWHWGDNGDFKCFFIADPVQKKGVVYFTNSSYGLSIRERIIALAFGGNHPVINCGLLRGYGKADSPWMEFVGVLVNENPEAALGTYHSLLKDYPPTEIIPEYPMNDLGYVFLRKEQFQVAISLFKLNVEIYPESWNVYDSLGEAYMKRGDQILAIKNYKKSLELNPGNENAENMLKQLTKHP